MAFLSHKHLVEMATETELKLLVCADIDAAAQVEAQLLPQLSQQVEPRQMALINRYFDTPDKKLRAMDMGFRVRGRDGHFQQTLKTAGVEAGGLHSRPEYNIELADQHPDLTLFDAQIWPAGVSVGQLQEEIKPLFTTHFLRRAYDLKLSENEQVELVIDKGQVATEDHQQPLYEVELELQAGEPRILYELGLKLIDVLPVRLGILSKAARGYMLLGGDQLQPRGLPDFLPLDESGTVEDAFCKAMHYGLSHWQYHEQCYFDTQKPKALGGVRTGIQMVCQAISLYLPLLQCDQLLNLQTRLIALLNDWYWVETLLGIKELRSRKGPFRKRLGKSEDLLSYLRGRHEGLVLQNKPDELILNKQNVRLQLELALMTLDKPWRNVGQGWQSPVMEHARGWLAQGWFNISQSMPRRKKLNAQNYLANEPLLKQTLFNGLFLAGLFSQDHRDQFRAPWLDILDGIEELRILSLLKAELEVADVEDKQELHGWIKDKFSHLLAVMEQSRKVALKLEPYWK
ncbi:CYTH domain-containing protein [Aliiglaciecola sp. CAU 1673]|uniref:CYTH domain-containing protein n=1 Tax=Aliiglaciecola sp. CAU 1673 TaxID=3032595 RepID=UPI0023DA725A|nr:CYTH domain-containing protein [Aliiglaciecola sp. CAU 1673]MDF2178987.1 CYTH domain-containing protein [Aliiglaciecola sp. CAU 1673]